MTLHYLAMGLIISSVCKKTPKNTCAERSRGKKQMSSKFQFSKLQFSKQFGY